MVYDKLTYAGSLENLRDVESEERFTFVRGDIADRDQVREAFRLHRPTAVLNLAAESHVDRSIDGPGRIRAHQHRRHLRVAGSDPRASR